MISSGINLVMTVIGFAASTMFIVFVCTRLICARIQLNSSRRAFRIASGPDLNILDRGLHGLVPLVLANFPTKKYSDAFFSSAGDAQCSVCLAEYLKEDTLQILPFCGHYFHATCIDIWLQQHPTCPVCRISLRDLTEKKRLMQPMFSSAIRSQYSTESPGTNYYHCLLSGQRASTRALNCSMDSIQGDQFLTDGSGEPGESNSILCDDHQITKDSRNKRVECPSNT